MDRGVYFIWALLPFTLFCLVIWCKLRRFFRNFGQEPINDYVRWTVFATAGLIIAIGCDKFFTNSVQEHFDLSEDTYNVISWLMYPAVLLAMAKIDEHLKKEKETKRVQPSRRH